MSSCPSISLLKDIKLCLWQKIRCLDRHNGTLDQQSYAGSSENVSQEWKLDGYVWGEKKLWKLLFLEWVTPANKSNIKPEEGVE